MSVRTRIKICGITRQADAELALELGVDALGFVLEPSSRRSIHDNPEALAIPPLLGPYALCVAVLGPYRPTPPQFHIVQCLEELPDTELRPSLRVIRVSPHDTVESLLARLGTRRSVMLDAFDAERYGGTGKSVDWELAAEVVARTSAKVVLAGGLTPDTVSRAIEAVRPYAVDVSSGVEAEAGIKDPAKLRAFIEAAN